MFHFCSINCAMQCVDATLEEMELHVQLCPSCRQLNGEILRAAVEPACAVKGVPCPLPQEKCEEEEVPLPHVPDACPPCPRMKCKGGRISLSPFFNFLREQRPKACGERQADFAVRQAKIWNEMTQGQKEKYSKSSIYKEARGNNKP